MGAGASLEFQWLRCHASTAGGIGSIPGQGTKIPHATQSSQKKKRKQISGWKGEIQEGRPWKIWPGLQNLVRELLYDLATLLLQIYPKEVKMETRTFVHLYS